MADNLKITLSLTGLAETLRGFKAVQDAALKTGGVVSGATSGPYAKGTGGGTPLQQARAVAQQQIFTAKVIKAQQDQQYKQQVNLLRLQREQARTEKAIRPKSPSNLSSRMTSFVRSTRFGNGGGLEPLVGKGLDLFGESALGDAVGPIGLFATGVLKAGEVLRKFVDSTAESTARLSSLRYGTGGSLREAARLKGLAGSIGLSPEDAAGVAAGIDAASTSGGLGAAYAQRAGIDIIPAPWGSADRSQKALQAFKYIANAKDEREAVNFARQTGSEAFLKVRDLSPEARAEAVRAAENSYQSQRQVTTGADYISSVNNLEQAKQKILNNYGTGPQRFMTNVNNTTAEVLTTASDPNAVANIAAQSVQNATRPGMVNPVFASASPRARAATERYLSATEAHTKALQTHTDAMNKNAQQQGRIMPGVYGNASRGDAFTDGMGGLALRKAIASDKAGFQLGAF